MEGGGIYLDHITASEKGKTRSVLIGIAAICQMVMFLEKKKKMGGSDWSYIS